ASVVPESRSQLLAVPPTQDGSSRQRESTHPRTVRGELMSREYAAARAAEQVPRDRDAPDGPIPRWRFASVHEPPSLPGDGAPTRFGRDSVPRRPETRP